MSDRGSVLLVDEDRASGEMLEAALTGYGFRVRSETDAAMAMEALSTEPADVLLADLPLHGTAWVELCRSSTERLPDLPVVVVTVYGDLRTATATIHAGAYDFVEKPFEVDALALVLDRAVAHHTLRRELHRLREIAGAPPRAEAMLGDSHPIRALRDVIECVAGSDATVLITGESGTGKRLAARLLHEGSATRVERPFVTVNCSAIPEEQLEAELFEVSGRTRAGRPAPVARARGGTLLLDDVDAVPLALQAKLVRALEEWRAPRAAAGRDASLGPRVVCATRLDLEAAVEAGRFHRELLPQLRGVDLAIPPLRARGTDVLQLAHHFLRTTAETWRTEAKRLSAGAATKLLTYDWPGNVRELRSVLERAAALSRSGEIAHHDLPERVREAASSRSSTVEDTTNCTLEEVERRHIVRVLEAVGGNKKLAARVLGLDRSTLFRKLERWSVAAEDEN